MGTLRNDHRRTEERQQTWLSAGLSWLTPPDRAVCVMRNYTSATLRLCLKLSTRKRQCGGSQWNEFYGLVYNSHSLPEGFSRRQFLARPRRSQGSIVSSKCHILPYTIRCHLSETLPAAPSPEPIGNFMLIFCPFHSEIGQSSWNGSQQLGRCVRKCQAA